MCKNFQRLFQIFLYIPKQFVKNIFCLFGNEATFFLYIVVYSVFKDSQCRTFPASLLVTLHILHYIDLADALIQSNLTYRKTIHLIYWNNSGRMLCQKPLFIVKSGHRGHSISQLACGSADFILFSSIRLTVQVMRMAWWEDGRGGVREAVGEK